MVDKYPYNEKLESQVLGSLIADSSKMIDVADLLNDNCFYLDKHKKIYECINSIHNEMMDINILTVTEKLKSLGNHTKQNESYMIEMATQSGVFNVEEVCLILKEYAIKRSLIDMSLKVQQMACDKTTDAFDALDFSSKSLDDISETSYVVQYKTIDTVLSQSIKEIEEAGTKKGKVVGVKSGFKSIDEITTGWNKSDLIILAARPGMGKSTLARTFALNAALQSNSNVAFFSLEESSSQIGKKLISSLTDIPFEKIKTGLLSDEEWAKINSDLSVLNDKNIIVDDTGGISTNELKNKCRKIHRKNKLDLIIVDYLQLMRGSERVNNREQEIGSISRSLKGLAKELDVPILALSQLSRAVEQRQDKKPMLSDLRESGSIEQDADIVTFVYRPEYYGITTTSKHENIEGKAKFIIAKHRSGKLGEIKLEFRGEVSKFVEDELFF